MLLSAVKWCLKSPAFLGVMLGALVTSTFPQSIGAAPVSPAPYSSSSPPSCQQSWPAEIDDFVRTQCDIHAALFGSDEEPGAAFAFTKNITRTGIQEGLTWFGESVVLEVISATPLTFDRVQNPQIPEGFSATVVVGRMTGPIGRVGVLGIHMKTAGLTEDSDYIFVPAEVMSEIDIELHARFERLSAGVRVVNSHTGQSMPLAIVPNGVYGSLSMSVTDMSTLYGNPLTVLNQPGVDLECVKNAYRAAGIDRDAAEEQMKNCVISAVEAFTIAMGFCIAGSFWNAIAPGITVLCALAALAYMVQQMNSCRRSWEIELRRIENQLQRELERCGVVPMET